MYSKDTPHEYARRINEVINFIVANLAEDLSLQTLGKVANYSPFHFQKIFKQVTGESPKQFIIRTRLETAAHSLIVHRHKSVTEIALDSGFSSAATFARAFKKYFGISSEQFRDLPPNERGKIEQALNYRKQNKTALTPIIISKSELEACVKSLNVVVKKTDGFRGIFVNAGLNDTDAIQSAFTKVYKLADTFDLLSASSKFIGIIYLHHNLYRALITVDAHKEIPERLNTTEIQAGKFATQKTTGNLPKTMEKLVAFFEFWLPESGYRIADTFFFEILTENPVGKSYEIIEKEIYTPLTPSE